MAMINKMNNKTYTQIKIGYYAVVVASKVTVNKITGETLFQYNGSKPVMITSDINAALSQLDKLTEEGKYATVVTPDRFRNGKMLNAIRSIVAGGRVMDWWALGFTMIASCEGGHRISHEAEFLFSTKTGKSHAQVWDMLKVEQGIMPWGCQHVVARIEYMRRRSEYRFRRLRSNGDGVGGVLTDFTHRSERPVDYVPVEGGTENHNTAPCRCNK